MGLESDPLQAKTGLSKLASELVFLRLVEPCEPEPHCAVVTLHGAGGRSVGHVLNMHAWLPPLAETIPATVKNLPVAEGAVTAYRQPAGSVAGGAGSRQTSTTLVAKGFMEAGPAEARRTRRRPRLGPLG